MNLERLRLFIAAIIDRLIAASALVGSQAEKLAAKDAIIADRDQTIADLKALIEALNANEGAENVALDSAIEAIKAYQFPAVEPEIPEEPEPLPQFEEVIPEIAIEDDNVAFEPENAPTVGDSTIETPTDTVEAAAEAVVQSFAAE